MGVVLMCFAITQTSGLVALWVAGFALLLWGCVGDAGWDE